MSGVGHRIIKKDYKSGWSTYNELQEFSLVIIKAQRFFSGSLIERKGLTLVKNLN